MSLPGSPLVLALTVAILWSIPSITQTLLLRRFPLHVIMTMSAVFYFLIVIFFMLPRWSFQAADEIKLFGDHSPWIVLAMASAFFGGFLPNYVFSSLLQSHPAYWVTALTYCSPLFTTVLAMLFLHERPTSRELFGIGLVIAGIVCLSTRGGAS